MKICFLAGTLGRGGAERQLVYMLRAALNAGFSVRLICLTQGEAFESEIRSLGIEIDYVGRSAGRLKRLYDIVKNLKHNPADVLQSSHFYTNIYAGIAGRILKIPAIGAIRSDFESELKAHGWLGKWQLKLPKHLIVNSETALRRATGFGIAPKKIDFVKNVVEAGPDDGKVKPENSLNILFVGRLVPLKRPELFVRAASLLEKRLAGYKLNFTVVGDGELRTELENLAKNLELKRNRVLFLGWRDDVGEIYRQADILVLTSRYEGTPNTLLEAMAYGLPVVAFNVGGVAAILDETRGILVDSGDEENLVQAVEKLVSDGDLRFRLGAQAREYVETHHSLPYLETRLGEIYRHLLTER